MHKFLPKTAKNPSGFTLVELLVVISIIAILSVIGMAVFTGVQKNGRDARRKADVDAISKALEANYSGTGYPLLADSMFAGGTIPKDPLGTVYITSGAAKDAPGATYKVCADLENVANADGIVQGKSEDYCKKEQQS